MSFRPARMRSLGTFVPIVLLTAWSGGCGDRGLPDGGAQAEHAAVIEPFLEVEADPRWRGLAAYSPRADTEGREREAPAKDGYRTLWHPNGVKRGEGLYEHGKRQGPWTWWYDSGQKRWEGTYVDDRPEGHETSWFESGQVEYEGTFHAERRDGAWQRWHDNGKLAVRGTYRAGKREGEFRYWGYDGELDGELSGVYLDDVKVSELPE